IRGMRGSPVGLWQAGRKFLQTGPPQEWVVCLHPSRTLPRPADDQEQEHSSERGVDTHAWAQGAAPTAPARTAPARTARLHRRGEGWLGIEEHGAVAIVLRQRINVGEVA